MSNFKRGLLRSDFTLKVKTHRATYVLKYRQATIAEQIEFDFEVEEKGSVWWLYEFVRDHTVSCERSRWWKFWKVTPREFGDIPPKELAKLMDAIRESRYKVPKSRPKVGSWNPQFESFIAFLSEKLSVSPIELMETFTMEQAILLSRGIEYNANEATPEGKQKNLIEEQWQEMGSSEDALAVALALRDKTRNPQK